MFIVPDAVDGVLVDLVRGGLNEDATFGVIFHSLDLFFQNFVQIHFSELFWKMIYNFEIFVLFVEEIVVCCRDWQDKQEFDWGQTRKVDKNLIKSKCYGFNKFLESEKILET